MNDPSAASCGLRATLAAFSLAALVFLAACAGSRGGPIPYEVKDFGQPDAPVVATLEEDYRIAPLDTLTVNVFRVPEFSGEFEVDLLGNINMPLIGSVKAIDKTTRQLQTELAGRLDRQYLNNADVSVGVKSSTRQSVTVDGSVRQPGMHPITGSMTLLQAIALARGPDENANPRRVAIFRQVGGQRMAAAFDLVSIRRGEAEDPKVYSGDIIVVDGSQVKDIQRQLLQTIPLLRIFRPF